MAPFPHSIIAPGVGNHRLQAISLTQDSLQARSLASSDVKTPAAVMSTVVRAKDGHCDQHRSGQITGGSAITINLLRSTV